MWTVDRACIEDNVIHHYTGGDEFVHAFKPLENDLAVDSRIAIQKVKWNPNPVFMGLIASGGNSGELIVSNVFPN